MRKTVKTLAILGGTWRLGGEENRRNSPIA
jgi:hypothetical protein